MTILRGTKIRVFPSRRQSALMDLWRRRCISLWNLLLQLEQAAYSGENTRSKLSWRKIWAQIVEDDYETTAHVYVHGAVRKSDSGWIKEPGVGREEEREVLKQRLKKTKNFSERQQLKGKLRRIAAQPQPIDPSYLEKIRWSWRWDGAPLSGRLMHKLFGYLSKRGKPCDHTHRHTLAWLEKSRLSAKADEVIAWLREHDGPCDCEAVKTAAKRYAEISKEYQPRLLFSQGNLQSFQKLMARLKQHPQTAWIGDLPSHAAQKTVSDMVAAVDAMLREKGKAARGEVSRKTGFPRFKPQHYAAGSVYFANTQLEFDFAKRRAKFPNGCGWMSCELPRQLCAAYAELGAEEFARQYRLMGGRIWRQGERWYLSCQWQLPQPDALPEIGDTAGINIAASILLTTYDDRGQTREYVMPPPDRKLGGKHRRAAKSLSRVLDAQKRREKKIKLNGYSVRRERRLAASGKKDKSLRLARTQYFFERSAEIAGYEAIERDRRDGFLHRLTTEIVGRFDKIAAQRMDVAAMMEKESTRKRRHLARHENAARDETKRCRPMKPVRKLMRHVAMARCFQLLEYKFKELRGSDAWHEIDKHKPNVQPCSGCGTIHPEMKDGRRMLRCDVCGTALPRNRNAAKVSKRELDNQPKGKEAS